MTQQKTRNSEGTRSGYEALVKTLWIALALLFVTTVLTLFVAWRFDIKSPNDKMALTSLFLAITSCFSTAATIKGMVWPSK